MLRYRAVVRTVQDKKKGEDKQWIEIWTDQFKVRTINLEAAGRHGKIYDEDGHFGSLEWNSAETHLLYVAERKKPKSKSYFDTNPRCDSESEESQTISRGEEYVYQDNWGEQMTEKSRSVLCVLDVESGIIRYV
jgi:acylaminoacyl-peptidase